MMMLSLNRFKQKYLIFYFSLLLSISNVYADERELDIGMNQVTSHELAMLAVVINSCPKLIEVTPEYQNNIKAIVATYLPDSKNPLAELQIYSQSEELRPLMLESQQIFNSMGDKSNKTLCEDIRDHK